MAWNGDAFSLTDAEMITLMDGHRPPPAGPQRDGYFTVLETRIETAYGYPALSALALIAGAGPAAYDEWAMNRAIANTRKPRR